MKESESWSEKALRRAKFFDKFAEYLIKGGGIAVIITVAGILFLVLRTALPLFSGADISTLLEEKPQVAAPRVLAAGVGEYLKNVHLILDDGKVRFLRQVEEGEGLRPVPPGDDRPAFPGELKAVRRHGDRYTLLGKDGSTALIRVAYRTEYRPGGKSIRHPRIEQEAMLPAVGDEREVSCAVRSGEESVRRLCLLENGRLRLDQVAGEDEDEYEEDGGEAGAMTSRLLNTPDPVTRALFSGDGSRIWAADKGGRLIYVELDDAGETLQHISRGTGRQITAMEFFFGDLTVAVGDASGDLSAWFMVRGESGTDITMVRPLLRGKGAIRHLAPSSRDKSMVVADAGGEISAVFLTSGRQLFRAQSGTPVRALGYSKRNNGILAVGADGAIRLWATDAPHPEISSKTLLGKVWYENYTKPEFVWQSTGGTDEFESKLSLIPLIYGTLKSTFYAMLFAVPISLLGAIYTSQFAGARVRAAVKPAVEILASVPSVVVGFLAALWLAPLLSNEMVALGICLLSVPLGLMIFIALWSFVQHIPRVQLVQKGNEFIIVLPVLLLAVWLTVKLSPGLESMIFDQDFTLWLYQSAGIGFDQRNTVVIAIALGFALIPIIFSLAEDSLSTVPGSLNAASLAMGASRWQTVQRVILPSASPGIFVAVMIGLGRAVGETMIVLMATGNTPLMSMNPFQGLRTLSANIAVEVPEAPVDGTLYRTLFLCGVLLFTMTFCVNTLGEFFRQRLREKYGRF